MAGIKRATAGRATDCAASDRIDLIVNGGIGKARGRHPVGGTLADAERVLVTQTRVAREANISTQLQAVRSLGPGKIIDKIVDGGLGIVSVVDALVESV